MSHIIECLQNYTEAWPKMDIANDVEKLKSTIARQITEARESATPTESEFEARAEAETKARKKKPPIQGITQEELAARMGVDRNLVKHWEIGDREIRASGLKAVAEALNVSVDWLLDPTKSKERVAQIAAIEEYTGLSANTIKTLHAFSHYPAITSFLNHIARYRNLYTLYSLFYAAALSSRLDKSNPDNANEKHRTIRPRTKAKAFDPITGEVTLSANTAWSYFAESARHMATEIAERAAAAAIVKAERDVNETDENDLESRATGFIQFLERSHVLEKEAQE